MATLQSTRCQVRYRLRWFKSKGAALILVWNLCAVAAVTLTLELAIYLNIKHSTVTGDTPTLVIGVVGFLLFILAALLSGWLADARFGNYGVFKFGSRLFFFALAVHCTVVLAVDSTQLDREQYLPVYILLLGLQSLAICAFIAYFTVSLQLGLDQLYDASSESITSFIFWYSVSIVSGIWTGISLYLVLVHVHCVTETSAEMIASFIAVLFMSFVLCSDFILSPKFLTIEPKSPQSLKNIYRVLKFAAKHKAPVNRSALTYWEEDVPSRLDLGKDRYGGPFTTEQVETVKTFLKLLLVFLPLGLTVPALSPSFELPSRSSILSISNLSTCETALVYTFTYSHLWCDILAAVLYELLIYPLLGHKLPKLLTRIIFASFLTVLLDIADLSWSISYTHISDLYQYSYLYLIARQIVAFCIFHHLLTSVLEFTCAQSPYNMRGLLFGYTVSVVAFSGISLKPIDSLFIRFCDDKCPVVRDSLTLALGILGFILHCILARWYKMRVREDIDCTQALVEDVYDRYLTQERSQRCTYQQD